MTTPVHLTAWAVRHGISAAAVADLLNVFIPPAPVGAADTPTSEGYVQSAVRLEAPYHDVWLHRNNVGVLEDKTGRPVRYGLANDSKQLNEVCKSGDLIGVRKVLITPPMVGSYIGQFVSRECKHASWTWTGSPRETAQLNWALAVTRYGGDARFVTGSGSFGP